MADTENNRDIIDETPELSDITENAPAEAEATSVDTAAIQSTYDEIERRARRRKIIRSALLYIFLTICAIAVLFPFYWMILTSFKTQSAYNGEAVPKFYVAEPTGANYKEAFTAGPLAGYFLNTLIYTVVYPECT